MNSSLFLNFYVARSSNVEGRSIAMRQLVSQTECFVHLHHRRGEIDPPRLDPVRIVDRLRNTRVERACYTR